MEETQTWTNAILLAIASPAKPTANHELLFRNQTLGATNREKNVRHYTLPSEKKSRLHPEKGRDRTHPLHLSSSRRHPKRENETYLKTRPKNNLLPSSITTLKKFLLAEENRQRGERDQRRRLVTRFHS